MKIIVTGPTGTVGSEVIRQAIRDEDIHEVIALTRRPIDIHHPRLRTITHKNFLDYSGLDAVFKGADACIWALGISQTQVSKEEYEVITHDYTIAAAKAMLNANPTISFIFVSGGGADSSEKSKTLFARVKGKTENELKRLPFIQLVIARPGGIKPVHKNPNAPFVVKLMIPLFPIFERLAPTLVISSVDLAKVLLNLVKKGSDKIILENVDLKRIAGDLPS
jgi:uncharacterized protein YbjT (DUF2867 family)